MKPYRGRKFNKEKAIYGVSIHKKTGKHYCFNRHYLTLPVELPNEVIDVIKQIYQGEYRDEHAAGHGRFKPDIKQREYEWETYWIFSDSSAPDWLKSSLEYDKSIYEESHL